MTSSFSESEVITDLVFLHLSHTPHTYTSKMSGRSALRLTRAAAPLFSGSASASRAVAARAFPAAQRGFSQTAVARSSRREGGEIPVSNYAPGAKGASGSIPVNRASATGQPAPINAEEDGDVTPLSQQVYSTMPPTMQKMSVMGKVVIVTG